MNETEKLRQDNKRLREIIGSWRRLAQKKAPRRQNIIREGYRAGEHYKVYAVYDVPGDLSIKESLIEIRDTFLPILLPYQFSRMDFSVKDRTWLVEVVAPMYVEMYTNMEIKEK